MTGGSLTRPNIIANSLSFYLLNPTSLIKAAALQQLTCDLVQFNIAVAIITETWFSSQHPDALLQIDGYHLYRRDRIDKKGGGVAIFVRNDINSNAVSFSRVQCDTLVEILWIRCTFLDAIYYIAGCYHPPKARYTDSVLTDLLSNQLDELFEIPITPADVTATFVIAGDFNTFNTGFLESDYGLVQIVNKPTHCNHIIDKFFTSRPEISYADVFSSCIKTKHQAACVCRNVHG